MGIQEHAHSMCTDYHAVAVVRQALSHGSIGDRVALARAILNHPGLLVSMARSRHGQEAVKRLLEMPAEEERTRAWHTLNDNLAELKRSRYGRVTAKYLDSHSPQLNQDGLEASGQEVQPPEEEARPHIVTD